MKPLPASRRLARTLTATGALAFVASGCGMSSRSVTEVDGTGGTGASVGTGVGGTHAGASGGSGGTSTSGTGANGGTGMCVPTDSDHDGAFVTCEIVKATPYSDDCDDSDPNLQVTAFRDADGDGSGILDKPVCMPGGELPPGYAISAGDCDEADPATFPGAVEIIGDGIDEDCNGTDGGVDCSTMGAFCPCLDALDAPKTSSTCGGFDLEVVAVISCAGGCRESFSYVQIGNIGSEDATGTITVAADNGSTVMLGGLAAGEVSMPFELSVYDATTLIVTSSEPGDCDPLNDTLDLGLRPLCQ